MSFVPGDSGYFFHEEARMQGLYPKYLVYRWPPIEGEPAIMATYMADEVSVGPDGVGEVWLELDLLDDFYFVLKPSHDQHARVALAAYAESVRPSDPRLAQDLDEVLSQEMTHDNL